MKRVYFRCKADISVNNTTIFAGQLLTIAQFNRMCNDNDVKYFDMLEVDDKETYQMFGIRRLERYARPRYFTADEKEKYL